MGNQICDLLHRALEMDAGLTDKVVLVTGATGGLGSEMVKSFEREGARVVIHYHQRANMAAQLAQGINSDRCVVVRADLSREEDVAALWVLRS